MSILGKIWMHSKKPVGQILIASTEAFSPKPFNHIAAQPATCLCSSDFSRVESLPAALGTVLLNSKGKDPTDLGEEPEATHLPECAAAPGPG